jgi:23S rRNA pseudouridine2604 synthase
LAQNNYATRKGADELIENGFVFINGRKAILGDQVRENDEVVVKKENLQNEYVYYAYNKPTGISTNKDSGAKDILSVTKFPTSVFPIGRLDKDSHGLIIMTNDGRVTDRLLSPVYTHDKEYVVKVEPNISDKFLELLQNGVHFDKFVSKKCRAWRLGTKKNTFHIILTEGKKRQIRRMCEALHHKVTDLKRIRVINIELGKINDGEYREIKGKELKEFLKILKLI